jgi:hypothetical protein
MPKKMSESAKTERLNLYLDPDLAQKLSDYCLALMAKQHKVIEAVKQKVGRKALEEWLQNHSTDFSVKL